jgi:class I fructose-bisphosphate aldolase
MAFSDRVKQILSWYSSETPGTREKIARLLTSGALAGTGKLVILPVDQGFEHGPARSFAVNPDAHDPDYHFRLAIDSGCNAYAAPLGALEAGAAQFAGQIPLILKLNGSDTLSKVEPCSAITGSVDDALRLGCSAVGYTIYPGSGARNTMIQDLREITYEAKQKGLCVIVWAYPRGSGISKQGETAIDVVAYAAHVCAQLGAHIIKIKPPSAHIEQPEAKQALESAGIPLAKLSDRVRYCVQAAFAGKRIVIFSGGAQKSTEDVIDEVREINAGGGFGSILGRNAFQRPRAEGIDLLRRVIGVYRSG